MESVWLVLAVIANEEWFVVMVVVGECASFPTNHAIWTVVTMVPVSALSQDRSASVRWGGKGKTVRFLFAIKYVKTMANASHPTNANVNLDGMGKAVRLLFAMKFVNTAANVSHGTNANVHLDGRVGIHFVKIILMNVRITKEAVPIDASTMMVRSSVGAKVLTL